MLNKEMCNVMVLACKISLCVLCFRQPIAYDDPWWSW
jgi:hypothetical protein